VPATARRPRAWCSLAGRTIRKATLPALTGLPAPPIAVLEASGRKASVFFCSIEQKAGVLVGCVCGAGAASRAAFFGGEPAFFACLPLLSFI
jgi:hypothetical protein